MKIDLFFGIDLAVIVLYFVTIIVVGLKFGEKEDNLEDFSLGGRSIPWWAVLASIIAAETSAATFIGTPGEGYGLVNYTYLQMAIGTILGRIIVAFLFIKPYFDLNVFSIYEYLEVRFGRGTRTAASAIFLVTRVLASGARLYVAAIVLAVAFNLITGAPPSTHEQLIVYMTAILLVTVSTAIYTSVGGIKAVVWTDLIQASVMFGGALAAIAVLALTMPQGSSSIIAFIQDPNTKLSMFSLGTDDKLSFIANVKRVLESEYTIYAALLGSTFITLATHGTDQDMVQRMLTATDYKKSRLSLICSGLADIPIVFIFITIGVLLHIHYGQVHDPMLPQKNNEVFAYYILKEMPVGLRGLLVAGIFATAMGSLSAALNALATSCTRDFFQSGKKEMSGAESVSAARKFTFIFAGLMILVAGITAYFVIEHPGSRIIPIVLGIFGYTYGSLLGVFLLGMLSKNRGNDTGNYIAMFAGFIFVSLISGLPNQILELLGLKPIDLLKTIPIVEFPWRIMFGSIVTLSIGLLFAGKPRQAPALVPSPAEGATGDDGKLS